MRFVAVVGVDGPCREEPPRQMLGENEVGRRVSRGQSMAVLFTY